MMATSHSVSGALLFAAVAAPLASATGAFTVDAPILIVGSLVCAGAALLPDIDHPAARLSNSIPPFTKMLAHFVETVAGGHRHMTHTIWFVVLAFLATAFQNVLFSPLQYVFGWLGSILPAEAGGAMTSLSEAFSDGRGGAFLIILYMVTMGVLCMNLPIISGLAKSRKAGGFAVLPPIIGAACAWWVVQQSGAPLYGFDSWLPWAVGLGCLAHDLGDMLTTGKVPFFELPYKGFARKFRIGIPILGSTSSARESALAFAMGFAFLFFLFRGIASLDNFTLPWA